MANPTVEKLKEVGLRFGDKVAVASDITAVRALPRIGAIQAVH